jgi:hypothetical protein
VSVRDTEAAESVFIFNRGSTNYHRTFGPGSYPCSIVHTGVKKKYIIYACVLIRHSLRSHLLHMIRGKEKKHLLHAGTGKFERQHAVGLQPIKKISRVRSHRLVYPCTHSRSTISKNKITSRLGLPSHGLSYIRVRIQYIYHCSR